MAVSSFGLYEFRSGPFSALSAPSNAVAPSEEAGAVVNHACRTGLEQLTDGVVVVFLCCKKERSPSLIAALGDHVDVHPRRTEHAYGFVVASGRAVINADFLFSRTC